MSDVVVLPASESVSNDTAEEAQLRAALEQADNEVAHEVAPDRVDLDKPEDKTQESESSADAVDKKDKTDSSETEADRKDGRDDKGRFTKKDGETQPAAKPTGEQKPEGEQQTQQQTQPQSKDEARLAKSWQQVTAEKTEVRNALAEIRQLRDQLSREAAQVRQAPTQQARFTSKEYLSAADDFENQAARLMREGDTDGATQKLELARQSRAAAQQYGQVEMTEAQRQQATNFEREWNRHAEDEIRAHPELGDPQTEEAQAMMELLEEYPILGHIPDGFKKGVELLTLRRDAAEVSGLRDKVKKLETENKSLRDKTSISGGGPADRVGTKNFDDMTLAEQESYLERQARAEDAAHTR